MARFVGHGVTHIYTTEEVGQTQRAPWVVVVVIEKVFHGIISIFHDDDVDTLLESSQSMHFKVEIA